MLIDYESLTKVGAIMGSGGLIVLDQNACIGCTLCAQHCPVDAIPMTPYQKHIIIDDRCTRCNTCRDVCPENAIRAV